MTQESDDPAIGLVVSVDNVLPGSDGAAVELDSEALRLLEEAEHEAAVQRLIAMKALVAKLAKKRDDSIKAKRPIDRMMMDSIRLYQGEDRYDDATKTQPVPTEGATRTLTPHILRARTDSWEARMSDMLSAQPWGLEPDCPQRDKNDPSYVADMQTRCDGMDETVKSQWAKCKADKHIRKMCKDAARMGTGLICGPFATVERKRRYVQQPPQNDWQAQGFTPPAQPSSRMMIEETTVPEIREGDPLCFFPDMTPSAEQAEFAHYLHLMGRMEVSNLAPGFDSLQVNALLKTEPELGEVKQTLQLRVQYLDQPEIYKDKYAVWHFTGVLGKDELDVLGLELPPECQCPDTELGAESPPEMAMADIWYCQDFVLRARLTKVPNDFRIPYYVFAPFRLDGSMFGMSLPMRGEDSQRALKAAWMMALHNQSVSSGPLIVERSGKMKPRDGQPNYRGPKVYAATDDDTQLDDMIRVFNIPNESEGALTIMDRAIGIMDMELNTAQWASQDTAQEHDTASGLAMIFNSQSILQLMVAAAADDDVFEPAVTRMIWWNNDNGDDESIKGDFVVKPLVQSERLVKDVQAQQAQVLAQLSDNPRFAPFSKDYDLYKYLVSFMDGPVSNLIKSESEVQEQMQNQQQDPQMLLMQAKTELEQAKAQTEQAKARTEQIKAEKAMMDMQMSQSMQGVPEDSEQAMKIRADYELKSRELDIREREIANDFNIAQMRQQGQELIVSARLAEERQKAAELAYEKQKARQTQVMLEGMKTENIAQELAVKRQTGSGI